MLSTEKFVSGAQLPSPAVDLCAGYLEALRVLERQLHGATTVQVTPATGRRAALRGVVTTRRAATRVCHRFECAQERGPMRVPEQLSL